MYLKRLPSTAEIKGRQRLLALRDQAISTGPQVLIVPWQNLEWTLLAVQPSADVVISDACELIPNLLRNPEALQQMRQRARRGNHLLGSPSPVLPPPSTNENAPGSDPEALR